MPDTTDVVVIGAGVVGCAAAYYLAREGVGVTLLEREAIGSGASAHATGSLSLLGAEFSPGASFQMARASSAEFEQIVPELEAATGMDLLYQRRPSLRLALDDDEADLIKSLMVWQQPHVAMHWIDGGEVRAIEPRLSPSIIGAVYEDESAQLDSYRLNLALGRGSELKGVNILYREVTGLVTDGHDGLRCEDLLRGSPLRYGGGGRRYLEPRLHSLAGLPGAGPSDEGRAAAAKLPGRAPSRPDKLSQAGPHGEPDGRLHQRRQHRRAGLRPEGAFLGRGV